MYSDASFPVSDLRSASLGKHGSVSNDEDSTSLPDSKRPLTHQSVGEPAPLLVLPAMGRHGHTVAQRVTDKRQMKLISSLKKEDSLLDTLISDLVCMCVVTVFSASKAKIDLFLSRPMIAIHWVNT